MCGISAIFSVESEKPLLHDVVSMTSLIRHRGPDDEGYLIYRFADNKVGVFGGGDTPGAVYKTEIDYLPDNSFQGKALETENIALGHRRLSIVDLSPTGHQPMSYANGRYWITYNGEVYNYLEIREELIGKGYTFISQSDTEVIMAAYDYWGKDCLHRFNGMFAFVLVDLEEEIIFVARDRFGVKPLYYWISPEGFFAFASEIKQFTVLPGWVPAMNGQRVYDYLCRGLSDHTSETMFKDVCQLRGGEALLLSFNELRKYRNEGQSKLPIYQWYQLTPRPFSGSLQEAADEYMELFTDAVRLRLRSDVQVGSCLSGGLDSSSIVCIANKLLQENGVTVNQKTFSACAHIKRFDERDYIDQVVRHIGVDAHYTYPSLDSLFEELDQITWHQDEPFGSTSIFAQWMVFKLAAKNNIKVMLDGQGGDEQLLGYHNFFITYLQELFYNADLISLLKEIVALKRTHNYSYSHSVKHLARSILLKSIISKPMRKKLRKLKDPVWLNVNMLNVSPVSSIDECNNRSLFEDASARIKNTVLPRLLHWEDRNSMAQSVESRVPFVDYRLMEFALGLPKAFKINNGVTKVVLREAMNGILPDPVRIRMDKMGFETPEEIWIKQENPEIFQSEILKTVELSNNLITPKALNEIDNIITGNKEYNWTPWRLISFGRWVEKFSIKI